MPSALTTALLQRRHDKLFCVPRTYLQRNATQFAGGIYQGYVLEVMLHEWLLSSPHRTLDPSEADWFYVPVYATCAIVTQIFETPSSPVRARAARGARAAPTARTALAPFLLALRCSSTASLSPSSSTSKPTPSCVSGCRTGMPRAAWTTYGPSGTTRARVRGPYSSPYSCLYPYPYP